MRRELLATAEFLANSAGCLDEETERGLDHCEFYVEACGGYEDEPERTIGDFLIDLEEHRAFRALGVAFQTLPQGGYGDRLERWLRSQEYAQVVSSARAFATLMRANGHLASPPS